MYLIIKISWNSRQIFLSNYCACKELKKLGQVQLATAIYKIKSWEHKYRIIAMYSSLTKAAM